MKKEFLVILLFSAVLIFVLTSCKKESWRSDLPVETPTSVSNTITGDYLYYSDNYEDGVGWNNRVGPVHVTADTFYHAILGYRQILYYPDNENRFRLHDPNVDLSETTHWTEYIMDLIENNSEYLLFNQLNTSEKSHLVRWYK